MEDKREWCVACEDAAKRMLKYLEDSEDVKVGLTELKEQLETPRQGMREPESFSIFSGTERIWCTSPAWRGGIHN